MADAPSDRLPYPLAMIVADESYRDPATGKRTLLGMFSAFGASVFPAVHPQMVVYVAIADALGPMDLRLSVVRVDHEDGEESEIASAENHFDSDDPLMVIEIEMKLRNLILPAPGEYRLQLFVNEQFLIERRIVLMQLGAPGE